MVDGTFGALTLGNRVFPSNNEASCLNELQSSLGSTLPSNIDNSLQSTYVLPLSQLRSLPTAFVSHGKAALPSHGPSRAPIASTGRFLHPIGGMSFSNFSLLNSQPSVGVQPNGNSCKDAQACTVKINSAKLAQQTNPQIPLCPILLCNLLSTLFLVHRILLRTFCKIFWKVELLMSLFQTSSLMSLAEIHSNALVEKNV